MLKRFAEPRFRSIILKTLIVILGVLGQILTFGRSGFKSAENLFYYTNISNILVFLLAFVLLARETRAIRDGREALHPPFLHTLRFILASGILLTFTVFNLLLLPSLPKSYLLSLNNLLVHNLVPLMACADFVLFDQSEKGKLKAAQGLILPALYLLFFLALTAFSFRFRTGAAPYFFMDYEKNSIFAIGDGKLGVFWWILLLVALQLVLSRLLLGLRKARER